jgi:hypothetical protein
VIISILVVVSLLLGQFSLALSKCSSVILLFVSLLIFAYEFYFSVLLLKNTMIILVCCTNIAVHENY